MILFPAIDLKNGQCVRLEQGDMARATVFNLDPAAQARSFQAQGFEYLHVVDLDGAFAGKPMNAQAVEAMLKVVSMPVQLGGGIRDLKTVEAWLAKGLKRVILGTAAVKNPALVREAEVHRDVYIDSEIFELEMENLFATTWVFVGHESQIPNSGDYFTTMIETDYHILPEDLYLEIVTEAMQLGVSVDYFLMEFCSVTE